MGRGGILCDQAAAVIQEMMTLPNIFVEGLFSHLASGEVPDDYSRQQWIAFDKLLKELDAMHIAIPLRHMSSSGGILNFPEFNLDMVRPGLIAYGIHPSPQTCAKANLHPVMTFKTRVVLVKDFPPGYSIGYGRTYTTDRPTRIATIPVGYGDGYGVILSNQGEVLIGGRRAPIVGRVSMDMCTIDVSHIPDCHVGEEVVLMGTQGGETISANDVARRVHTINYEVLCTLGKRAPRIFLQKGKTDSVLPRLRRIYVPEEEKSISRIDNIIRHCFQTRARNEEMGDAIYYEMFETLFGKADRQLELREDFRYDINVSEFSEEEIFTVGYRSDSLRVTTRIEYKKVLRNNLFIIGCAFNDEQLAALFEDPRCEYRWVMNPGDNPVMERDFHVVRVRIDDEDIPIIRAENTDRGYEVWCGNEHLKEKLGTRVTVIIEIFTKKSKSNNIFSVYLVYPTRGLDISFNYEQAALRHVREVSFFAGKHPYPDVRRERGKSVHLRVANDAWIFPNSGVTFVWDL